MLADTAMKAELQAEWDIETVKNPGLKEKKGAFLTFYTTRIGELYNAETQEMKDKVDVFREEEHKKNLESSAPPPLLLTHEQSLPESDRGILCATRVMQR